MSTAARSSKSSFRQALAAGSERLAAWSDLLDRINVFPVADGDTGRNLIISLQPLKDLERDDDALIEALMLSARGNSGNIAAQFFQGLLTGWRQRDLAAAVRQGREWAGRGVADPKPGTMLSLFDALSQALGERAAGVDGLLSVAELERVLDRLEQAVRDTCGQLTELTEAGVVDSGALGMFLFVDGFLNSLHGRPEAIRDLVGRFSGLIEVGADFEVHSERGFCVDAVIRARGAGALLDELRSMGESLVSLERGDLIKIHLHTTDPDSVRAKLRGSADVVRFASDDLQAQTDGFVRTDRKQAIHVMSDAAGSVTRTEARTLGMTLLDSYVQLGDQSLPETHLAPEQLYAAMRAGLAVSTAQASAFERHQHYQRALSLFERVLYVCVGSVFTGNHQVVLDWKRQHDPDGRLVVIDSGAASGRLALIALAAARRSLATGDPQAVLELARRAVEASQEWIFLDELKWLAAGGRLSKTSAFFGDLLSMKPVVSPAPEGVQKVAVVRNRQAQLEFALDRADELGRGRGPGLALLEYCDNREWVASVLRPALAQRLPGWELQLQPMSLTSGVHMGPGTWALACLPHLD